MFPWDSSAEKTRSAWQLVTREQDEVGKKDAGDNEICLKKEKLFYEMICVQTAIFSVL